MSSSTVPSAAAVLRRALLLWGAGHLGLGDRRGWLLLVLQPLAIAAVAGIAGLLIDSTRWTIVFPALAALIVLWLGQAVHAHQLAIERGAAGGGELLMAWTLPPIVVIVTAFWLIGGSQGSPASALQEYVADWQAGRAESAVPLFAEPMDSAELAAAWQQQDAYIRERVAEAAARYGSASGLDPDDPFSGLRFLELRRERSSEATVVAIDIVRRQRIETTLFGLIPTATQETVVVERAGLIHLRAVPAELPAWLPRLQPAPAVWRIEQLVLPVAGGTVAPAHHNL